MSHQDGKQHMVWLFPTQYPLSLSPEQALDILLNVHSIPPEQLRYDAIPEKPLCGALFVVLKSPDDPLEKDAYKWIDREVKYKMFIRNYVRMSEEAIAVYCGD